MELKRVINAGLLAEISQHSFYPVVLAFVDWPTGAIRVHSGAGSIFWDENGDDTAEEWQGIGQLGDIQIAEEGMGGVPTEAVLSITGSLEDILADITPDARGAEVGVWFGATTTPGGTTLIGNPLKVLVGSVDSDRFEYKPGEVVNFPISVRSGQPVRSSAQIVHSDEDQQVNHSGDTIFRRVAHADKWQGNLPQWPQP